MGAREGERVYVNCIQGYGSGVSDVEQKKERGNDKKRLSVVNDKGLGR